MIADLAAFLGLLFFAAGATAVLARGRRLIAATGPLLMAQGAVLVAAAPGARSEVTVLVIVGLALAWTIVATRILGTPAVPESAVREDEDAHG